MVLFLFLCLLLNQEHDVNNEHSQLIQSVRHSKLTHRMWTHQKDRICSNARGERAAKGGGVGGVGGENLAHSTTLVVLLY